MTLVEERLPEVVWFICCVVFRLSGNSVALPGNEIRKSYYQAFRSVGK